MGIVCNIDNRLSPAERSALAEHELTIRQGVTPFLAVGQALIAIRDSRLYRETHKTFKDYCRERWKMGQAKAYHLMYAAEIVQELPAESRSEVHNERQARALAAVPRHMRAKVLELAKEEGFTLTDQVVARIVSKLLDQQRASESAAARYPEIGETRDDEDEDGGELFDVAGEPGGPGEPDEADDANPVLARAAKAAAKKHPRLKRGLEHLRLAVKDLRRGTVEEMADAELRRVATERFAQAEKEFQRVEKLVDAAKREYVRKFRPKYLREEILD